MEFYIKYYNQLIDARPCASLYRRTKKAMALDSFS
jgi:hypothetical protein